jgi:hypothetical protein
MPTFASQALQGLEKARTAWDVQPHVTRRDDRLTAMIVWRSGERRRRPSSDGKLPLLLEPDPPEARALRFCR